MIVVSNVSKRRPVICSNLYWAATYCTWWYGALTIYPECTFCSFLQWNIRKHSVSNVFFMPKTFFMWISPYETLRVKKCRTMCECEFECVSPDIDWEPVQSLLHLLPNGSWNTLQPPCDPELDGWTDGHGRGFCSLKWMLFNCSSFKDFTESAKWSWSGKLFLSLDAADWRALSILLFRLEWRTTKRFWVF